jgi:hypothetical protein
MTRDEDLQNTADALTNKLRMTICLAVEPANSCDLSGADPVCVA